MLRAEQEQLVLEFQNQDGVFGVLKGKMKSIDIPYGDLEEVEYKVNWFVSRMKIQAKSMKYLENFPIHDRGMLSLKVPRKQKFKAQNFASFVNLRISEVRLDLLGEPGERYSE